MKMKSYNEMVTNVFRRIDEYHTKKKKKRKKSILIGCLAATLFSSVIILNLWYPVYARNIPFIGSAFQFIQEKLTFTGLYSNYAYQVGEVASNRGIDITLSEVYCDGTYLYVSYTVDGIDFSKDLSSGEYSNFQLLYYGDSYIVSDKKSTNLVEINTWAGMEGRFIDNDTFVGIDILHLEEKKAFPETFLLNIDISDLGLIGAKQKMISGKWHFEVGVNSNAEDVKVYEVNVLKDNHSIDRVKVSPIMVTVYTSFPNIYENTFNYQVMIYSDLDSTEWIAGVGELSNSRGVFSVPRDRVSKYLDIYVVDDSTYTDDEDPYDRSTIEQHAIVSHHLELE